jgi:DNA-binding transcriptional LysR family regulator
LQRHPELQVEIITTMRLADIIDLRLDLAIAVGALPDSSFAARALGYGQFVTVAAPAYLESAGLPRSPQELLQHRCVGYTRPDGRESPWEFSDHAIDVQAALRSDDMHHLAAMSVAGAGIAHLPLFVVARDLEAGRLLRLL